MELPDTNSRLASFFLANKLPVAIFLISFIILIGGLIVFAFPQRSSESVTFSLDETITPSVKSVNMIKELKTFVVDIAGAVKKPGVYELLEGSRLQDVLVQAGGFSPDADSEQIARQVNLAIKVSDGMKVYIPKIGEIPAVMSQQTLESGVKLININTASVSELDSLPGVGEVTAQKIITNRPYSDLDELQSKKAVSAKVFEQIKEQLML